MTPSEGDPLVFELRLRDAPDALLRVLDLFAVQGARLGTVEMRRTGETLRLRIEVVELVEERAARLAARLQGSMFVVSVQRL